MDGQPVICLACGGLVSGAPQDSHDERCSCEPVVREVAALVCPSCGGPLQVEARACPHCRATLATRRCPYCTAWNLAGARHCQACGRGMVQDDLVQARTTGLRCPRCQGGLNARQYAQLEVDECDGCGGMFIEPAMLDRLVDSRDASTNLHLALPRRPYEREQQVTYIRCPVCASMMNRKAFGRISGIIVDVCRQHGVWFDPGELAQVLAFVARGGLEKTRQREVEELRDTRSSLRAEQLRATLSRGLTQSSALEDQTALGRRSSLGVDFVRTLIDVWRDLR